MEGPFLKSPPNFGIRSNNMLGINILISFNKKWINTNRIWHNGGKNMIFPNQNQKEHQKVKAKVKAKENQLENQEKQKNNGQDPNLVKNKKGNLKRNED